MSKLSQITHIPIAYRRVYSYLHRTCLPPSEDSELITFSCLSILSASSSAYIQAPVSDYGENNVTWELAYIKIRS